MAKNANGKIELNSYDLVVKKFEDRNTQEMVDVVQLNPRLAFNPAFVQEMLNDGVVRQKEREE